MNQRTLHKELTLSHQSLPRKSSFSVLKSIISRLIRNMPPWASQPELSTLETTSIRSMAVSSPQLIFLPRTRSHHQVNQAPASTTLDAETRQFWRFKETWRLSRVPAMLLLSTQECQPLCRCSQCSSRENISSVSMMYMEALKDT